MGKLRWLCDNTTNKCYGLTTTEYNGCGDPRLVTKTATVGTAFGSWGPVRPRVYASHRCGAQLGRTVGADHWQLFGYGNATGAVFDLSLRNGNKDKLEKTVQLNLFSGLEAMIEGPMSKKKMEVPSW